MFKLSSKYGIFVPINVSGYGLRIMHISGGGGCYLACERIGNYCGVNAGVLCGKKNGNPIIGDFVTLAPGCKIIGNVTIGDHCLVAPNAVVVKNIDSNSIVAGVPAKLIKTVVNGVYS